MKQKKIIKEIENVREFFVERLVNHFVSASNSINRFYCCLETRWKSNNANIYSIEPHFAPTQSSIYGTHNDIDMRETPIERWSEPEMDG